MDELSKRQIVAELATKLMNDDGCFTIDEFVKAAEHVPGLITNDHATCEANWHRQVCRMLLWAAQVRVDGAICRLLPSLHVQMGGRIRRAYMAARSVALRPELITQLQEQHYRRMLMLQRRSTAWGLPPQLLIENYENAIAALLATEKGVMSGAA